MKTGQSITLALAYLLLLNVSKWRLLLPVAADSLARTDALTRRGLQQTHGSTTTEIYSLSTTVKPVTPSPQQPEEILPPELTNTPPLAADTVTVTLKIPGTTAEAFKQYYQSTVAAVVGSLTGTPKDLWKFSNIGTTAESPPSNKDDSAGSNPGNTASSNANSSNNNSSIKQTSSNSLTASSTAAASSDNLQNSVIADSERDGRGLLQHIHLLQRPSNKESAEQIAQLRPSRRHRHLLQEQAYEVSLSLLTLSPQLVVYRLTQANAAAASLSSGCKTEFCVRLKTAKVPIDGNSIHVAPDMAALIGKYGSADGTAVAEAKGEDPAEKQRVSTIMAGIVGSVGGVLLIVAIAIIFVKLKRSYALRAAMGNKSTPQSKALDSKLVTPRGDGQVSTFTGPQQHSTKQQLQGSPQIQTVHSVLAGQTATAVRTDPAAEVNDAPSLTITVSNTTTGSGDSSSPYPEAGASPLNAETLRSLNHSSNAHNNRAAVAARLVPWVTDLPVQSDHPDPNCSDLEACKADDDMSESSFVIERGHQLHGSHRRSQSRDYDEQTRTHADLMVRIGPTASSVASPNSNVLRLGSRGSVPGSALSSHPVPGFTTPPRYPGSAYSRRQSSYAGSMVSTPGLSNHGSLMGMIDPKALHDALHQCYVSLQQVHELISPAGTPGQSPMQTPKHPSRTNSVSNVLDPRHFNSYILP